MEEKENFGKASDEYPLRVSEKLLPRMLELGTALGSLKI